MDEQSRDVRRRPREIGLWVLQTLLAVMFVFSGYVAFAGDEKTVRTFDAVGAGPWLRFATGTAEIAGGIGLLIPFLAGAAALGLMAVMAGAVLTEAVLVEVGAPVLPLVLFVLTGVVAVFRRHDVAALPARLRITGSSSGK